MKEWFGIGDGSISSNKCIYSALIYVIFFVSALYLALFTNFLQTLYRSSYRKGVVWD